MSIFRGLFYYPGLAFISNDSPLREGMNTKVQLLSLTPVAEVEQPGEMAQQGPTSLVLVYNYLSPLQASGKEFLLQRLWSGAVFSFEYPSSQYAWTQEFVSAISDSQTSSATGPSAMLFSKLRLYDGVLPPEQAEGAGIEVYEENSQVAVGFRSMVERKLADQEALARASQS